MGKGNRVRSKRRPAAAPTKVPVNASCYACGDAFDSGLTQELVFDQNGQLRIRFEYNPVVSCPTCGSEIMNRTVEHVQGYQIIQVGTKMLAALPISHLITVREQLELVRSGALTIEEAHRSSTDSLSGFWSMLPKTRTELYAALSLLLAAIAIIISLRPTNDSPAITPSQLEQILHSVTADAPAARPTPITPEPPTTMAEKEHRHPPGQPQAPPP